MTDDIKKINEQIQSILDNDKRMQENINGEHEIIFDKEDDFDNLEENTKKVHDIKEVQEENQVVKEDTKRIESVSEIETEEISIEPLKEEIEDMVDNDNTIINSLIVLLMVINIFLIVLIIFGN